MRFSVELSYDYHKNELDKIDLITQALYEWQCVPTC